MRPFLLAPDNFTSPSRTPWGGTRLLSKYKAALGLRAPDGSGRVGESWELSAGSELPSRVADGRALPELLAADPDAMLGDEAKRGRITSALLVKWLDADDDLSLQIHPRDDYAALAPGEAGKVEAWYVVEAQPGAGFWFGFRPGVTERDVRSALAGGDLRDCLCFAPAEPGDLALIEPGMPHAVGRGLTLIEPQRVRPDCRALTYRYWDFDRRYDTAGRPDPRGTPRALHLEHALAVTAWAQATDPRYAAGRRARSGRAEVDGAPRLERLVGRSPEAGVQSDALTVSRLCGDGRAALPSERVLRSLTVVEGSVTLTADGGEPLVVRAGTTAALPAALPAVDCRLERAHALVCSVLG